MPILEHRGKVEAVRSLCLWWGVGKIRDKTSWVIDIHSSVSDLRLYHRWVLHSGKVGGAKSGQHHYHPWSTTHLTNNRFSSVKTQATGLPRNMGKHCTHHLLKGSYIPKLSKTSGIQKNLCMETKWGEKSWVFLSSSGLESGQSTHIT